jgi:hypothetical protein
MSTSASVTAAFAVTGTYTYTDGRAITIDHTKVPNTDQANVPFPSGKQPPALVLTLTGLAK